MYPCAVKPAGHCSQGVNEGNGGGLPHFRPTCEAGHFITCSRKAEARDADRALVNDLLQSSPTEEVGSISTSSRRAVPLSPMRSSSCY